MTGWQFSLEPLIDPGRFFGRQGIIDEIRRLMTAGPSPDFVFVHGGQKIGRTSLLKQLHAQSLPLLGPGVRTSLVDLRLWSGLEPEAIVGHFAEGLRDVLQEPELSGASAPGPYLFEHILRDLACRRDQQLVLLVDRGDKLVHARLRRGVSELLGMLNDSLPNLGIVLSFGTSEELGSQHVLHRMEQIDDAVREISPVWTRTTPRLLGSLPRVETERFLAAAGPRAQERGWIVDLAGDHPFLLNRVGLTASRGSQIERGGRLDAEGRVALEETLVRELMPMGRAILQRLRSDARGNELEDFAADLAAAAEPTLRRLSWPDAEPVGILAGEGLVQVEDADGAPVVLPVAEMEAADVRYWMPARLFRRVLLAARTQDPTHVARPRRVTLAAAIGRERAAHVEVALTGEAAGVARVALTDIERRILERLLQERDKLLDAAELARAAWGPAVTDGEREQWQDRLRQRLLGLRRKLAPHVVGEPITNVYGQGYRLESPGRYAIRLHDGRSSPGK